MGKFVRESVAPVPVAAPVAPPAVQDVIQLPAPTPAPIVVRPGDLILVRAIKWWDSGQLKRVAGGIAFTAAPVIYDLFQHNSLTWRTAVSAVVGAIFAWIGISRAKAPDVVTGVKTLDKANAPAYVPAKLLSDLQRREAKAPEAGA
jgi:hypothetical protein